MIIRFVTGFATSGCVETSYLTSSFETPFSDELGILAHGRVVEINALGEVQVVLPASLKGATYSGDNTIFSDQLPQIFSCQNHLGKNRFEPELRPETS